MPRSRNKYSSHNWYPSSFIITKLYRFFLTTKWIFFTLTTLYISKEIIKTKDYSVAQAVETIRNRLDQFGLSEPTVVRQGDSDIVVQLPGIKTASDEKAARDLISKAAKLELMAVDEERMDRVYQMTSKEAAAFGDVILEDTNDSNKKYCKNIFKW